MANSIKLDLNLNTNVMLCAICAVLKMWKAPVEEFLLLVKLWAPASLVVSDLRSETSGSRFESGC